MTFPEVWYNVIMMEFFNTMMWICIVATAALCVIALIEGDDDDL